ncbi:MAG: serine/threonine-protein kinase [Gammaproteobacteria bacterium]|nr:serine/threonine-protein kinase [Gammaproteobacteria bacterium]
MLRSHSQAHILSQLSEAKVQEPNQVLPASSANDASSQFNILLNNLQYNALQFKEPLGVGSYNDAFRAIWNGIDVTAKQIHKEGFKKEKVLDYFNAEVEILSTLHHPNIIKLHGSTNNPKYCIVTEYMPQSLFARLDQPKSASWPLERYNIILGIARALDYLHDKDILHRDVKAENILLDEAMNPKLADFGFAIKIDAGVDHIKDYCGTLAYLAPETIISHHQGKKSDIFNFGMTIWEVVTCMSPFSLEKEGVAPRITMHGGRERIPENCDPKIAHLIRWCWDQDPAKRPTAKEIVTYLESDAGANNASPIAEEKSTADQAAVSSEPPKKDHTNQPSQTKGLCCVIC